jgi:hypothetical protein
MTPAEQELERQRKTQRSIRLRLRDPNPAWARPAIERLQAAMTPDLLKPEWRGGLTPTAGHCYAASEALFHALGKQEAGWKSLSMKVGEATHWCLLHVESGVLLDPTWDQFGKIAPYEQAKGTGFLTRAPSKRAQEMMRRAGWSPECLRDLASEALALTVARASRPSGEKRAEPAAAKEPARSGASESARRAPRLARP